jgi:hypothetical protein
VLLPASAKPGEHALERALLGKLPQSMAETMADYEKKINKREDRDLPLKWTYDELVQELAGEYLRSSAAATVKKAWTGGGVAVCVRCGLEGHKASEKKPNGEYVCKGICDCGSRLCTGCYKGGECVVMADEMPPRNKLLNAKGKTYPHVCLAVFMKSGFDTLKFPLKFQPWGLPLSKGHVTDATVMNLT